MVTGGAGFLGSHLADRLLETGCDVICVDNFHTGRKTNIRHLMSNPRFRLIDHDIVTPFDASLGSVDEIYNLACPASPPHYQADPVKTSLTCSVGVYNCLQKAADDSARVFQASTSEIYGDPDVHPQRESYWGNVNSVGPRSCYDEGKRFAETLVTDFCASHQLTARIVRIFNTYGPRMQPDDGRVVSNFIVQALRGEDIAIYGSGDQTRSFCYVDDLIDGFVRLMSLGGDKVGPINLGNPVEITVAELAGIVIEMTGSHSRVVYRPLPIDDPRRRRPDITRARHLLDWEPRVPLRAGLERTIEYFEADLREGGLLAAPMRAG
jgi:UDP-glucuronate decarboxylase